MYELPEIREARDTWAAAIVRQYKAITRARGGAGAACKIHQGSPYLRDKAIMSEQDKKLCIMFTKYIGVPKQWRKVEWHSI